MLQDIPKVCESFKWFRDLSPRVGSNRSIWYNAVRVKYTFRWSHGIQTSTIVTDEKTWCSNTHICVYVYMRGLRANGTQTIIFVVCHSTFVIAPLSLQKFNHYNFAAAALPLHLCHCSSVIAPLSLRFYHCSVATSSCHCINVTAPPMSLQLLQLCVCTLRLHLLTTPFVAKLLPLQLCHCIVVAAALSRHLCNSTLAAAPLSPHLCRCSFVSSLKNERQV